MNKFKSALIMVVLTLSQYAFAQQDESVDSKTYNHYLSVQANQLARQIANFGGSSQNVSNPYLINYSINTKQSGWGLSTGLGYEQDHFSEDVPDGKRVSDIGDLSYRIGLDKKRFYNESWMFGWGVDLKTGYALNKTSNDFKSGSFTQVIVTKNFIRSIGGGPRVNFAWKVNDWFMIMTEASYYFTKSETVSKFKSYDVNSTSAGNVKSDEEVEKFKSRRSRTQLDLPVVLNLTFLL